MEVVEDRGQSASLRRRMSLSARACSMVEWEIVGDGGMGAIVLRACPTMDIVRRSLSLSSIEQESLDSHLFRDTFARHPAPVVRDFWQRLSETNGPDESPFVPNHPRDLLVSGMFSCVGWGHLYGCSGHVIFTAVYREMEPGTGTGTKEWWGPRIWKILHSLAEVSDRSDCMFRWKHVLRLTAEVMPCEACRIHFQQRIPLYHASATLPRETVRERIREFLWSAHQDVNGAHAKTGLQLADVAPTYGVREGATREQILQMVVSLVEEVVARFTADHVLDRFHANIPIQWKRDIMLLIHGLSLPDATPPPPPFSVRRWGTRPGRRM